MSDEIARAALVRHVEAAAPLVGLSIPPERIDAVVDNLALCARLAALVGDWPLADGDEPAAVFRP